MVIEELNRTLDYRAPPFPEDFGERLERLKEMTGLSWAEFRRASRRYAARPVEVAQGRTTFGSLSLGHT